MKNMGNNHIFTLFLSLHLVSNGLRKHLSMCSIYWLSFVIKCVQKFGVRGEQRIREGKRGEGND